MDIQRTADIYGYGATDLIALADTVGLPAMRIVEILEPLLAHGLIESGGGPALC